MKSDEYMNIVAAYNKSIFQDFESFLRTEIDLVKDYVRLVLDEYNSNFITYEIKPGTYTFKDLSEVLTKSSHLGFVGFNNSINVEFNDITMKAKLIVRPVLLLQDLMKSHFLVLSLDSIHIQIINILLNTLVRKF